MIFLLRLGSSSDIEELDHKMQLLEQKYSRIQIAAVIKDIGTEKQRKLADENNILTTERICIALNMFEKVLLNVKHILVSDTIWKGSFPPNGVMWVDECVEFHRIWSAVQFAFCLPQVTTPSQGGLPLIEWVLITYDVHYIQIQFKRDFWRRCSFCWLLHYSFTRAMETL